LQFEVDIEEEDLAKYPSKQPELGNEVTLYGKGLSGSDYSKGERIFLSTMVVRKATMVVAWDPVCNEEYKKKNYTGNTENEIFKNRKWPTNSCFVARSTSGKDCVVRLFMNNPLIN